MKKNTNRIYSLLVLILISAAGVSAAAKTITYGDWTVKVDDKNGAVSLVLSDKPLLSGSVAQWSTGADTVSFADCTGIKVTSHDSDGLFGKQRTVTVAGKKADTDVKQRINLYADRDFATTELELSSKKGLESRYMAPVAVSDTYRVFDRTGNNVVFIPYDNDAWVRYSLSPFGKPSPESYEVTAIVNADTREGLILGSIEHDTWKTGIKVADDGACSLDTLVVYGGIATPLTRDLIPHGAVKGNTVKSPLVMVGRFEDWRDGMETFGDACAAVAPKIPGEYPRPFGWNSWGKLQADITYDKAVEVSDFFADNLQPASFENEGVVYIGLDSFWNRAFTDEQHRKFVENCRRHGQKAGIYYCPFTDWGRRPEAHVYRGSDARYKDVYLYTNGQPHEFDGAYAIDPTHPAVKEAIRRQFEQFIDWGYEFVKIDFMAHGAYEADSHYDPSVTTGVQAYNQGMQFIDSVADGKLWINLSIAPLFPGNYAHSRRIGCDAWANIDNTEYTLNALTYGWWLDHIYHYNDADHIVLEGVSDGENRARVTSSAITGVYFLGDDMSLGGDEKVKKRIVRNLTNPDINRMARECKAFRPVELGHGDRAADTFCYKTPDCLYVAVFNFGQRAARKNIPLRRLGLSEGKEYKAVELWSADPVNLNGSLSPEIPGKDVKVYKITL